MECPYCGSELEWEDSYGTKEYIIYGDENYKSGDIYSCPNHYGFNNKEDAIEYALKSDIIYDDWQDIVCDSNMHNVSGSFYTDKQGDLHEGYPC